LWQHILLVKKKLGSGTMSDDLLKLFEIFDKNTGWFFDFLVIVVSISIAILIGIYLYRFASGKIDLMGRKMEEPNQQSQMALIQLESCRKENEELEKKQVLLEQERQELLDLLKEKEQELGKNAANLKKAVQEIEILKGLYEELDAKYDDETYTMSQIMYTADEVAAAIANEERFNQNRDDIFMNLLDYLVNTLKNFREKNPRVIIHVKHPNQKERLTHYAHSSGHTHRVKIYEPPIYGSAAGRVWRTQDVYYVPDVEDQQYEYDQKEHSRKVYRSILCIPLKAGVSHSNIIGVLSITGTPVNAFEKIEIERSLIFASLIYPLIYIDLKRQGRLP
jgi:hypothetical protein